MWEEFLRLLEVLIVFWVIVDRFSTERLARIYICKDNLGTRVDLSIAFHPQTNGQSERTIQVLKDMLQSCMLEFGGQWDQFLPLAEFAYNNNYHSNIQMAQFEALYGRHCRSLVGWFEFTMPRPHGTNLIQEALEQVKVTCASVDAVELDDRLTFMEEPVSILSRDMQELCSRFIPMVKVRWRHHPIE
ncbi:hypothetical protein MTR67_002727 [Solanum verrucosum]|uniref:Integrase catalytic domain-containing protein n=1 Tax=Solanum verrucosum TaxID=315347 RepID=A0AAF0PR61_SOLVR|nr:hypothetical protein MTR67_002727 [Solanum verrucosum]